MTLTKIKDAFAIFKNFVLEERMSNKNTNNNGNSNIDMENRNDSRDENLYDNEENNCDINDKSKKNKNKNKNSQNNGVKNYENQITDFKSLLLQRDTEISILVNSRFN